MIEILIVDDDELTLEVVKDSLNEKFKNFNITLSDSGYDAIEKLQKKTNFDYIISDYNMPKGDGSDIMRFLIANTYQSKFILFSSELSPVLPKEQYLHFLGHVEKFKFSDLFEVIQSELLKKEIQKKEI